MTSESTARLKNAPAEISYLAFRTRLPPATLTKPAALIVAQLHDRLNSECRQPLVKRQVCRRATHRVSSLNSQGRRSSGGLGTIR